MAAGSLSQFAEPGQGLRHLVGVKADRIELVLKLSNFRASLAAPVVVAKVVPGGASSTTRGLFGGGAAASGYLTAIEYITIASTGNGTSFGDLTVSGEYPAGFSNGHGGLAA